MKASDEMHPAWCANNLNLALNEKPIGVYRQVIFNRVLVRTNSESQASNAVKLTVLAFLKEAKMKTGCKWEPNADHSHNRCKRFVFYYALANMLGWTEQRTVMPEREGDGSEDQGDGISHAVHVAVNSIWPGDGHDLPLDPPADQSSTDDDDVFDRFV